ncbi:MAG: histidine kinase [Chitinophagaceae bacterium]
MHLRFLLLVSFYSTLVFSQQYNYVRYDVKDGLAGSTVYDICQDKEGFIWLATEGGVSRFDGTHFTNFTPDNGLPSNEILRVFADTKGRIWIAPFKNALYYYYKNKISCRENDSLLKHIELNGFVRNVVEDIEGNVLIHTGEKVILIQQDGSPPISYYIKNLKFISTNAPGTGFLLATPDSISLLDKGKLSFWKLQPSINKDNQVSVSFPDGRNVILDKKPGTLNIDVQNSRVSFINTDNGTWEVDTLKPAYKQFYLPGIAVSHSLIDNENNKWFATLGQGLFKLASNEFVNYVAPGQPQSEIYSLEKWNNIVVAGSNHSRLYLLKNSNIDSADFKSLLRTNLSQSRDRAYKLKKLSGGDLIAGFDVMIIRLSAGNKVKAVQTNIAVKSIYEISKDTLLVATNTNVQLLNANTLLPIDTIWKQRATTAYYTNNEFYIGTTDGLYCVQRNGSSQFIGDSISVLAGHIGEILPGDDGILWITTFGKGVAGIKNKKLIYHFSLANGISSNVCRTMFIDKKDIWIGTDKGLNKINLTPGDNSITRYNSSDGLASDIVNSIYADGDSIYIGSPAGLAFFNEKKIPRSATCNLKILSVNIANTLYPTDSSYAISYKENNVKLNFIAISFRSEGDITYRYRLKGLNDNWDSTRQTTLEYPSLPAGEFSLELLAINRFGEKSNLVVIHFSIKPPFWQTVWFWVLMAAILITIAGFIMRYQFNKFKSKEEEKAMIREKLSEMEQKALRAQMNPHFIFNCLSSIQGFIINKDFEKTNKYLSQFAHLIRQTLDNSDKPVISIENEKSYLRSYLEVEKMRYDQVFSYGIDVTPDIEQDFTFIPCMLLQPYVENSIRHGLRYKEDNTGMILIKFEKTEKGLTCIVEDNGIGRQKALEYKSRVHIEYQSKGMTLADERIKTLNQKLNEKINIDIIDLMDDYNQPAGTRVIIFFPTSSLKMM